MAFHKPQIIGNLDIIIEQTDEAYSIYAITNVVTTHIALQEAARARFSGVPTKKSLSFIISQEWEAFPTLLEGNEVPYLNPKRHITKSPLEDRYRTVLNSRFLLTTYGNEMRWLRLFQLVSQPVEVLVPPADRILWQIKLCSRGLEKNRIRLVCTETSHFRA